MRIIHKLFTAAALLAAFSVSVGAKCSDPKSALAALIRVGSDSPTTTPLILIHGIHGTADDADVSVDNLNWADFKRLFQESQSDLSKSFSLYLFQYCSDREGIPEISGKLRDLIDSRLADRDHMLVAHSMGGLVAKAYMAETTHLSGRWKGKKGGESTIGLITLATPHHGTPGANDPSTMVRFVPDDYQLFYAALNKLYWRSRKAKDSLDVIPSTQPNRTDLRWDNYDRTLNLATDDANTALAKTNLAFSPFQPKLIAYAGMAPSDISLLDSVALLIEAKLGDDKAISRHRMLTLTNAGLVYGLGKHFGEADGLVPYSSALFCKSDPGPPVPRPKNYVCATDSRVRRFETGKGGEVDASALPDKNTLSIFTSLQGFDHLDMLVSPDVLRYVMKDLAEMAKVPASVEVKAANK